jgi:hypothetical protein
MLCFELSGYGYRKKLCENVITWFIKHYLPRHKIDLFINHRGLKREGVYGFASIDSPYYNPRSFLIEIQSHLEEEDYISTLLHELWHVYQWVKGSMKEKGNKRLWKNIDYTEVSYENQPWEIEAKNMEIILLQQYLDNTLHTK